MPTKCPHCGKSLDEAAAFSLPAILIGAMDRVGGAEQFGRTLGEEFQKAKGNTKLGWGRTLRDIALEADKQQRTKQMLETWGEEDLDGVLMEHFLSKLHGDEEFRGRFLRAVTKRRILPGLPEPVDAEYERVE